VQFLGINPNDGDDSVINFIFRDDITFPVVIDRTGEIWNLFCAGFTNYFIVIDSGMVIRYIETDYIEQDILNTMKKYLPKSLDF